MVVRRATSDRIPSPRLEPIRTARRCSRKNWPDGFNKFLAELETEGYQPPKEFGVRSTGKYFAASLSGVWARSPYLHNGSVRTMEELLTSPSARAKTFHRGSRDYDPAQMGYTDAGTYVFDTSMSGNSNAGHDYGTALSAEEKHELIEYLKML